jgi:hypothetical protein
MNLKPTKFNATALAGLSVLLTAQSCKKYEEGPGFTLKSANSRLEGEWLLTGGDVYDEDLDVTFEFADDGDFSYAVTISYFGYSYTYDQSGSWEWLDNKDGLSIDFDGDVEEFAIKMLTSDEMKLEDEDSNEWEFEKQ